MLVIEVFVQLRCCRIVIEQLAQARTRFHIAEFLHEVHHNGTVLFSAHRNPALIKPLEQVGKDLRDCQVALRSLRSRGIGSFHGLHVGRWEPNASAVHRRRACWTALGAGGCRKDTTNYSSISGTMGAMRLL